MSRKKKNPQCPIKEFPLSEDAKLRLTFDGSARRVIERLQKATGNRSFVQVVRDALGLYAWLNDRSREGFRLALLDKDGVPVKEIVLPFDRQ